MTDRERTHATLRCAEQTFARTLAASEAQRRHRNYLIRVALADGWTHAEIAEATGLSRWRVGQIAQRKEER